jgi:hypothetical protein
MGYERPQSLDDQSVAVPASPLDYYAVLASVVEQTKHQPAQLRAMIYELARVNLKREAVMRYPQLSRAEFTQHMYELERAIERFEADASGQYDNMVFRPHALLEGPGDNSGNSLVIVPERTAVTSFDDPIRVSLDSSGYYAPIRNRPEQSWSGVKNALQLVGAAVIAVAIYAAISGQFNFGRSSQTSRATDQSARAPATPQLPAAGLAGANQDAPTNVGSAVAAAPIPVQPALPFPMPASYGLYAVSNGQLSELEALPIKMPDPRVQMSAEITKPSATVVPDGKVSFVVFRRDLANSAPEKASVRVVAQVAREMTFKAGKATVNPVEGEWRIRNQSYDFKVSPLPHNKEMILIQADAETVLPAGRYALAFGGFGYDFSVAGPVTAPAQCMERTETTSGMIYSECRKP